MPRHFQGLEQSPQAEAVVKEYAERLSAVRAELWKVGPWGDHRLETGADFVSGRLQGGVRMHVRCAVCGSWIAGTEQSATREGFVEAARRLVLAFRSYYPEDCDEALRTNLVREVMES